ncbi:MAG TPA: acyl-CoA carboxylase subunit epsilon [Nocardioidaceae bacterium]|nr:acyl-CoA carboxylase subunit epsilon [Nocardioidaceae bacterium]
MTDVGDSQAPPLLRVVRGDPTPEELAALVTVLAARRSRPGRPAFRRRSTWPDRRRALRRPLHAGPGGWLDSARPR